jgi:hypothetical protein
MQQLFKFISILEVFLQIDRKKLAIGNFSIDVTTVGKNG